MPIRSSLRSSDIPSGAGVVVPDGLPLGLDAAGRLKRAPSDPSQPPVELRPLRPTLVRLVLLPPDERPGGLPRRAGLRVEDAPRLVLAYCRVLVLVLFLRC